MTRVAIAHRDGLLSACILEDRDMCKWLCKVQMNRCATHAEFVIVQEFCWVACHERDYSNVS